MTCEALVPFMALFYVVGCGIILFLNAQHVLPAIELIVKSAFTPQAVGGGFAGASVMMAARYGIARGLFSNESGLGSAPIVAAAARTRNPVRQALVSATGTFWDTVVVCAMTGLVIVSSILRDPAAFEALRGNGALFTKAAFAQIPFVGPTVLVGGLDHFCFFNHSRLVLLRRASHGISVRQKSDSAVPRRLGHGSLCRFGHDHASCMGPC